MELKMGLQAPCTLLGSHHPFPGEPSAPQHSLSSQALHFYLSFSVRPAFHTCSWVSCCCLCSDTVPVERSKSFHPGHTWSQQMYCGMEGAPVQFSSLMPSKDPDGTWEYIGSSKTKTSSVSSKFKGCVSHLTSTNVQNVWAKMISKLSKIWS